MKIAVTGGSGLVGRAVIRLALAQGHTVISLDQKPLPEEMKQPGLAAATVDMTDYAALEQGIRGADALIHLAAITNPHQQPDDVVHNTNVVGSYNALSAAARLGIQRVCLASSINAVGAAFSRWPRFDYFPLDENHPTYNEDPYSLSKWICEQQADSFARRYEGMVIATLRLHGVVADRAAVTHSALSVEGAARQLWGYTTENAAACACLLALTAPFTGHERFFIVAPTTMTDQPSLELKARFFPDVPLRCDLPGQQGFFNTAKATHLLGWHHDD